VHEGAARWLADLAKATEGQDKTLFRSLFEENATWRDNAAVTWTFESSQDRDAFEQRWLPTASEMEATNFRFTDEWHLPGDVVVNGAPAFELIFAFETSVGNCTALVLGDSDPASPYGFRATTMYTRLDELKAAPVRPSPPSGYGYTPDFPEQNWLENREARHSFEDRDPTVLIVGGGHGGMSMAASLDRIGIDNLIVDKNPRVGDNWRLRYHNLALHNPTAMNHLPYIQFPENFPEYLSKDKFANFLETYAENLDLAFWTSTEFLGGTYDKEAKTWTARLRLADGSERVMHPQHIVMATGGIGGLPNIPELPGLDAFAGEVEHSTQFTGPEDHAGKKVVVIGVGTSAHDISADLCRAGIDVTMVQRGPLIVVNIETANLIYSDFSQKVAPLEVIDLRAAAAFIYPTKMVGRAKDYVKLAEERDRDILQGLEAAGMELWQGEDGTGWFVHAIRYNSGYYINVGTSELIADGQIKLQQWRDVDQFVSDGLRLQDGTVIPADLVILATGFQNRNAELAYFFDQEVADKIGPIFVFDEKGEMRNTYTPTAQEGLWIWAGGAAPTRWYAPTAAALIAAELKGIAPEPDVRRREVAV
jgi:cation diffusion facilitator CzcD-associated flavoprotein CzcO